MTPIFIDLETRSACDLPARGSWQYAKDETTRLLTVAWRTDGQDYVWLPGLSDPPQVAISDCHLPGVQIRVGERVPAELCAVRNRPWVGHNAWTFDRLVWNECTEGFEDVKWLDSYPLALAAGLPGGLDKIGQFLWGEGKYDAGSKALKKAMKCEGLHDCEPENVPIGQLMLVAKYNVQDVRLTEALWNSLPPSQEPDVLAAHHAINHRGCRLDRPLVLALIDLAEQAKDKAIKQIAELTNGALPDKAAVQSRAKVLAWLDSQGVEGFRTSGLRKEIVQRFLKENVHGATDEDEDAGAHEDEASVKNLALVVKVLELRMQALRITGGKLETALQTMDDDDRARGMFVYWGAHTGRWAGRKINLQNLPRPKDGIDTWALCDLFDRTGRLEYDAVASMLPLGDPLYPFLSVDDGASALLRSVILPDVGDTLLTADYAAIECRILAWMAGEKWLMDSFWSGDCPYLRMAEMIVQKKREDWPVYPDPKTGKPLPLKKHPYRQIIGKIPELSAGYQVGGAKMEMYAASQGHDLRAYGTTGKQCVIAYRRGHPAIAGEEAGEYNGTPYFRGGLWCQLNNAVLMTVASGHTTYAGKCEFSKEGTSLICTLPSGRRLTYREARIEMVQPSWAKGTDKFVEAVTYWSPRYGRKALYGGAIAENIVQAASRDVLAHAIVGLEYSSLPVVFHCHDEAGSTGAPERYEDFMRIMSTPPSWLTDFPLDCEGGIAHRYAKTPPPGVKEQVWRNGARHA